MKDEEEMGNESRKQNVTEYVDNKEEDMKEVEIDAQDDCIGCVEKRGSLCMENQEKNQHFDYINVKIFSSFYLYYIVMFVVK